MTQTPDTEIVDAEIVDEHTDETPAGAAAGQHERQAAEGGVVGPLRRGYASARAFAQREDVARHRSWVSEQSRLLADGMRGRALARREVEQLAEYREHGDPDAPVRDDLRSHYEKALDRREKQRAAASDEWSVEDWVRYGGWGALGAGELMFLGELVGSVPGMLGWLAGLSNAVVVPLLAGRLRRDGRAYRDKLAAREHARQTASEVTVDGQLPVRPIAEAASEEQAAELVRRALASAQIAVRPVLAEATAWGWAVTVDLVGGARKTPADVVKAAAELEVALNVGENGVLVAPHRDRKARLTLRIVESDPFANVPVPAAYRPGSRSISQPIYAGQRLDSALVSVPIPSTHGIVLAPSGGGKSILLRVLVDGLGAAGDVIQWDLDPTGRGQGAQKQLFRRRALSPDDCETALALAVRIAKARTALNLADDWPASAQHPALVIHLDEFPRLSAVGKKLAVELLRIGRKAGVWLVLATQDAKTDALGEDIAADLGFQAGGPGLNDWRTRMLFGEQAQAEGWQPGRYKPKLSDDDVRDAGTFFLRGTTVSTGVADAPMPTRIAHLPAAQAAERAAAYREHGLAAWDADTIRAVGLATEDLDSATSATAAAAAATQAQQETEQRSELQLTDDQAAILAAAAETYADVDEEWITAGELLAEIAVGELGMTESKGTQMAIAGAMKGADVERTEDRSSTGGNRIVRYRLADIRTAAHALAQPA